MKRFFSAFLALCLCLALLPALPASAAGEVWDGTVDISWYDPEASEYYLSTPAQLAGLAALVNGMADPSCPKLIGDERYLVSVPVDDFMLVGAGGGNVSDIVYTSAVDFAYKTLFLTADMDMGGRYNEVSGVWLGPNWTPIGGKFPMLPDEVVGDCLTLDTRFNGVLDGQGHNIYNLYCDRYAAKGFPYSMAIGVVGFLGGTGGKSDSDVTAFENGWQPGVCNLVLASGSIRGRRMVGGIVGRVDETNNGVFVENCANFASVHSTDAKGVGGIVGSGWGKGVIRGCYNAGAISTTYSSPAGGIVGTEGGMDIYCCYNIGTINTNGQSRGRAIGSHDTGIYTVANCLYLEGSGDDEANPGFYIGGSKRISVSVVGMSEAELKSEEAYRILNTDGAVFAPDRKGVNNGYPVLWFQNGEAGSGACRLSVRQSEGGTIAIEEGDTVAFGKSVTLSYTAESGYELDHFTVNGEAISSNIFTATGDAVVSAVFKHLRLVTLTLPESRDYYVAVSRSGNRATAEGFESVAGEMLRSGDTLVEGNILKVLTYGYADATPEDMNLEYIDAYELTLPGTVKNTDGSYTVTGEADVAASVSRKTQPKAWINWADTGWYDTHPRQSEYTLTTAEELAGLAYLVNRQGLSFAGVTIRLGNDISLENTDGTVGTRYWTPIGSNANKCFQGCFDGQGHAVYDLQIGASSSYAALFGCCKNAAIENVSVYGAVSGSAASAYAAGIAAYVSGGSIVNCANYADIAATGTYAGGIAAMIRDGAAVEACFNYGPVTASSGLGGIVGVSDSGEDSITGCANFAVLSSTGNSTYGVGGIAGRLAGTVSGCVNYGAVGGTDRYTGGVVGYATTKNQSTVLDSANRAAVSSSNAMATAALGGIVGYAQFLSMGNGENTGDVLPLEGFGSEHVGDEIGRVGTTPVKELRSDKEIPAYSPVPARSFPRETKSSYTVRFVADGETVSTVNYTPGGAVSEPAVPQKAGYTGYWDHYTLGRKDLTVRAVYRQNLVGSGDTVTEDGSYFIAWYSAGEIAVADGVRAELNGSNGGEDGFDNLRITVGRGAALTLTDAILNGEGVMLCFTGNNALLLRGSSELYSRAEASGNPAVRVLGDLTVDGEGSLYIHAGLRNPALAMETPGSTLELRGGRLSVYKNTLLGVDGGVVYANGSSVVISGGELRGHTASDNVAVLSAASVSLRAGALYAQAEGCPKAVQAPVTASGGTIAVFGHTGNYTTDDIAYPGASGCESYSGSVAFSELLPFTDVFAADSYYDAVAWCYENGVFNGVSADSFAPDASMTRAMFVTVLYRLAGQPAVSGETAFTDLTQDWYRNAVAWAVGKGITNGISETTFSPNTPVTREQAAVFLYRYALSQGELDSLTAVGYGGSHGAFSAWAEAEGLWALNAGLFAGTRYAMTEPQTDAPRSLLAMVLHTYSRMLRA